MTNKLLLEPGRAGGPAGAGVHLLRGAKGPPGTPTAALWLTVTFVSGRTAKPRPGR